MLYKIVRAFVAILSIVAGALIGWIGVTIGIFEDCVAQVRRERAEYALHYGHKSYNFKMKYLLRKAKCDDLQSDDLKKANTLNLPPLPVALFIQFLSNIIIYPKLLFRVTIIGPKRIYKRLDKWARKWILV